MYSSISSGDLCDFAQVPTFWEKFNHFMNCAKCAMTSKQFNDFMNSIILWIQSFYEFDTFLNSIILWILKIQWYYEFNNFMNLQLYKFNNIMNSIILWIQ